MPLFLSTTTMKVDKKGRVSVPANFRTSVGDTGFAGVVLYPSFQHKCLHGADMGFMERLSDSIQGDFGLYSDDNDALANATLAAAVPLAFDPEGRVMLPAKLIEHAGISSQATFVGLGRTFQLWSPEAYATHADTQRASALEAAKRLSPMKPRGDAS